MPSDVKPRTLYQFINVCDWYLEHNMKNKIKITIKSLDFRHGYAVG